MSELSFIITPRIQHAIDLVLQRNAKTSEFDELSRYSSSTSSTSTTSTPISLSHLRLLSKLYRAHIRASVTTDNNRNSNNNPNNSNSNSDSMSGYLHDLIEGSEIYVHPPLVRKKSPEFEAELARIRQKTEVREYQSMVKGKTDTSIMSLINENKLTNKNKGGIGSLISEMSVGLNVVILMGTMFFVFYYIGKHQFNNDVKALICGLAGMIGTLLVEAILIIVRDQKKTMREQYTEQVREKEEKERVAKTKQWKALRERRELGELGQELGERKLPSS